MSNPRTPEAFGPPGEEFVADVVGYVQYGKPESTLSRTVGRVRIFLGFGVIGGTLLAFLGGLYVAQRAMRPIAGLTRAAREVIKTSVDINLQINWGRHARRKTRCCSGAGVKHSDPTATQIGEEIFPDKTLREPNNVWIVKSAARNRASGCRADSE